MGLELRAILQRAIGHNDQNKSTEIAILVKYNYY